MPAAPLFHLKKDSKLRHQSIVQSEAVSALTRNAESGVVVLPCGAGKTSIFLQVALSAGKKILFLSFEKQGLIQISDTILQHTNVNRAQVCVYSSDQKDEPNNLICWMVTTYSMFSASDKTRSSKTERVRKFVDTAAWDLVVLDECHHSSAATYKPLVLQLQTQAKRVLGFTGSLCRNDGKQDTFDFLGPVLFQRSCKELEALGLIARVRLMTVHVELTPWFRTAHELASGSSKKYIASMHPQKLDTLKAIVDLHTSVGEAGMIFVEHLLLASTIQKVLGDGWEILSGGDAHGAEESKHSAHENAKLVQKLNSGKLLGLITTPVGESALDINLCRFRYAILADGHGGPASAVQRPGRLSRTPRPASVEGEASEAFRQRCVASQKEACFYELVTTRTEEETAAAARKKQYDREGYAPVARSGEDLLARAPLATARFDDAAELRLLVEALKYQSLGEVAAEGRARARAVVQPTKLAIAKTRQKLGATSSSVFKDLGKRKLGRLKAQIGVDQKEAAETKRAVVSSAPHTELIQRVLRALALPPELYARANIAAPIATCADSSDESECETACGPPNGSSSSALRPQA